MSFKIRKENLIFLALFTIVIVAVVMRFRVFKRWCKDSGMDCRRDRAKGRRERTTRRRQVQEEKEC
ncbi:unnamed protein product [Orchesella dallaii]|uniref:Transmembrane protein n=1 Tax=Orchesella dallaii TaxID=48710 RepID=A0ABP1RP21_9HEXA